MLASEPLPDEVGRERETEGLGLVLPKRRKHRSYIDVIPRFHRRIICA